MKLKRSIGSGILAVLVGVPLIALPSYAQTTVTDARCTVAAGRITAYATEVSTLRDAHLATYQDILDQAQTLITSSSENGYDTTELAAAQDTTQTAIDTYTTNATNFETALASLQEYACGENEDQFVNALATARTTLTTLRTTSTTVKSTVLDELVPEIKAYATWLGTQEQASNATTEDQS